MTCSRQNCDTDTDDGTHCFSSYDYYFFLSYFSWLLSSSLGYCLIVALGLRIVFRSTRSRWTPFRAVRPVSHQGVTGSYDSLRRRRSSSSSSSSFSSSSLSSSFTSSSFSSCWWSGRRVFTHCLFLVGAVLLVITFATKTWTRNLDWADRRTLFEQVFLFHYALYKSYCRKQKEKKEKIVALFMSLCVHIQRALDLVNSR